MENHPKVQAVRDALDAAGARTADGAHRVDTGKVAAGLGVDAADGA
jgi:hypothetical protein